MRGVSRSILGRTVRHRPSSLVAYTAAGVVVVAATFMPWLRSGSTSRSSYDLLGVLARLDIAPNGLISALVTWWPMVPLIVTAAVVLAWWQRWALSLTAAVVAVLYAGGVGATMAVRSRGTGIGVGIGPWVCAVGSIVFLVTAAWMVFTHASARAAPIPLAAPVDDRS
jgi:hypothetical protein